MSRMSEVWKVILSLSLSGTVLMGMLLLFCRIFQRKLSRGWQYYIWLAVVARLLIPFSGELNLTGSVFAKLEQSAGQESLSAEAEQHAGQENLPAGTEQDVGRLQESVDISQEREITSVLQPEDAGRSAATPDSKEHVFGSEKAEQNGAEGTVAGILWLIGAAALLIRKIVIYQRFIRRMRAGSEPADLELLERFGRIAEEMGIKRTVELRINGLASSPLLAGFIRPMVILPSAELSEKDFRYTALHELTHYRRVDVCYKWLVQFVICLHWFNPFVRLLGRETDRACEFACDEAVVAKLTADEKRAYGDTLLHAAESGSVWRYHAGAVTLHESGKQLKGRLEAVMGYRKRTGWMKALSMALAAGVLGSAAVLGAYAGPKEEETSASEREEAGPFSEGKEELRFTGGGDDFLLTEGIHVIERDEVVYILCDGLTEEDVPLAGAVDGTMIMVVHRAFSGSARSAAAVTSVSATLSSDRSRILEEAEEICQKMQQKGILSENDAKLILETAGELQKRAQPASYDFDGSYYQGAHYQAPYLFSVGYDLTEEAVKQHAGIKITLEDGEELYVSFADSARDWMEDEDFLKALCTKFSEFRSQTGSRVSGLRRPIISSAEAAGYDVEGLTEAYYEEDDMGRFSVMVSELSADRQKEYLEKAYQDYNAAVLSIVLGLLYQNGDLKEEWISSLVSRAYEDGDIGFFAILLDYLDEQAQQEWYERLKREGRQNPWARILQGRIDDTDEDGWKDGLWENMETAGAPDGLWDMFAD